MALDLKKTIKGLTFFTRKLTMFGSTQRAGDQSVFDQRGAILIRDKEIRNKDGDIVKIRAISDAGGHDHAVDSMVISRPSSGQAINPARAMDSYHGWAYAAVKAIADEIAGIEWKLFKVKPNGDSEEVPEHEVLNFLDAVNDFQTGPEFKHVMATHLDIVGNAYIYLDGVESETSKPKSMHLLDPARVRVNVDKSTFPYKVANYTYRLDSNKEMTFQPYQIVHLKYPDPTNPFVGIGTVQGIAEWIDNDNNATEFLRQFFINGAQIGVTFETDMTSEEQLQELRDSFIEQHAGVKNAYKGIFLPKGVKKPANDVKFDDIGFDQISDSNRDKILAGFRVPKTILGAAESETNRATAETADYVFARRTIKPKMQLICSYLNEFLIPRFGDDIYLTFVDPVPEDNVTKSTEMRNAVSTMPVMTANEAREEYLGLGPVDGGDRLLTPNNFIPAEDAGTVPAYTLGKESDKVKSKKLVRLGYVPSRKFKGKTQFARNVETRKSIAKEIAERMAETLKTIKSKSLKDMTDSEYDSTILHEKRVRISDYAKQIQDELKKINGNQKKEVMDNLETALKSVKAVDPAKLFNLDKWINITVSAIKPIASRLFKAEADQALEVIDQPGLDVENTPEAQKAIDEAMGLMAESYNQDTVDILEAKINEGLENGFGVQKLGELVSDIYEWKDTYAAERVALTESNRITNTAGKMAWKESGVVTEMRWVTSGQDVCEFCQALNGETISIEKNFFDVGDTVTGRDGGKYEIDYTDLGNPPLHPNCHCGIKPVVSTTIEASAAKPAQKPDDEREIDEALNELRQLDHDQK